RVEHTFGAAGERGGTDQDQDERNVSHVTPRLPRHGWNNDLIERRSTRLRHGRSGGRPTTACASVNDGGPLAHPTRGKQHQQTSGRKRERATCSATIGTVRMASLVCLGGA